MPVDLNSLIDNSLAKEYDKPEFNADAARKPLFRMIDKASEQHSTGKLPRGDSWWNENNNIARVSLNVGGRALPIAGKDTVFVPSERFGDFLKGLRETVEAGTFDEALKDTDGAAAPKATGRGGPRGPRGPLSPEKLAARRAKMAEAGTRGGPKKAAS